MLSIFLQDQTRNQSQKTKIHHQAAELVNAMPLEGRRDRSYSDAHTLTYPETNSPHNTPSGITMGVEAINKVNAPSSNHKMKKHHQSRPRSKSLELHRHSTPIHKKKYPQHHRHSPGGHRGNGRISPSSFPKEPKLEGRLWVRHAATRSPFLPALETVAPSPLNSNQQEQIDANMISSNSNKTSSQRQVMADGQSSSPTSFNDGMWLYRSPNSFFEDSYQQRQQGPSRIIFGENGKPIKPRSDCL